MFHSETLAAIGHGYVVKLRCVRAHSWNILLLPGDDSGVGFLSHLTAFLLRMSEFVNERTPTHVGLSLLDLIRGTIGLLSFLRSPVFLTLRGRHLVRRDARLDNGWLVSGNKKESKRDEAC